MGTSHLKPEDYSHILSLSQGGASVSHIVFTTPFTERQVRRVLRTQAIAPKPRPGRAKVISDAERTALEELVTSSQEMRRMTYAELSKHFANGKYDEKAIRSCMLDMGFRRRVARVKPPQSDAN